MKPQWHARKEAAKIFMMKFENYRKYIQKLLKIDKQGFVLEKDYRELSTLFKERIMLYPGKKYPEMIADNLIAIGNCVGLKEQDLKNSERLQEPVSAIINILTKDLGLGGQLDDEILVKLEKSENELFPRLFRQAIKEILDNVLVNHSDYDLLNRGEFVKKKDGEYIIFPFINKYPYGCKLMVGPFCDKPDTDILFLLFVPRYLKEANPYRLLSTTMSINLIDFYIFDSDMPMSVSQPMRDSWLIELEIEDCDNSPVKSFSFEDQTTFDKYHQNYPDISFSIGQRVKYIYLHARLYDIDKPLYRYIADLQKMDECTICSSFPWGFDIDDEIIQ